MKIEDQVCSLANAKKLKELGIKQDSLFCFTSHYDIEFLPTDCRNNDVCMAAYTASELLEIIPYYINTKKDEPFNCYKFYMEMMKLYTNDKITRVNTINYYCDTTETFGENAWFKKKLIHTNIYNQNLADCFAELLIYIIENKFYEV